MNVWIVVLAWMAASVGSFAHEVRPAYLELTERAPGEFEVLWKVPAAGGVPLAGDGVPHSELLPEATGKTMPCGCPLPAQFSHGVLPVHPSMPVDARVITPPIVERIQGAEVRRWRIATGPRGLEGWIVGVHGLQQTMVDVLVRVSLADGRVVSRLLRPDDPTFVMGEHLTGPAAAGYFGLGVEHIWSGIDHLLFVLALMLIVRGPLLLLKTITAFTVAHSITLALATLGHVSLPAAPVEAVIALSIVFVAAEIIRTKRGQTGITERSPWLVAFVFGLLHGFGFAGALGEVGLPQNDIPLALFLFNVGVEAGQLAFVTLMLVLTAPARRPSVQLPRWVTTLPPYAIGGVAMFWVIERVSLL